MRMFTERSLPARIQVGWRPTDGELYFRYDAEGLIEYLSFWGEGEVIATNQPDPGQRVNLREELQRTLLGPLGPANSLTLRHRRRVIFQGEERYCEVIEELTPDQGADLDLDPSHRGLLTKLTVLFKRREFIVSDNSDPSVAVHKLSRQFGVQVQACAGCKHWGIPKSRGTEARHGGFCLRDTEDRESLIQEPELALWRDRTWSCVDAYHGCPSFQPAYEDRASSNQPERAKRDYSAGFPTKGTQIYTLSRTTDFAMDCLASLTLRSEPHLPLCEVQPTTRHNYQLPEAHILPEDHPLHKIIRRFARAKPREKEYAPDGSPIRSALTDSDFYATTVNEFEQLANSIRLALGLPGWVPIEPNARFGCYRFQSFYLERGLVSAAIRWGEEECLLIAPNLAKAFEEIGVDNQLINIYKGKTVVTWKECVAKWAPTLESIHDLPANAIYKVVGLNGLYLHQSLAEKLPAALFWPMSFEKV